MSGMTASSSSAARLRDRGDRERPESRTSTSHDRRPSSSLSNTYTRPLSSFSNHQASIKTPSAARYGGLAERDIQKITSSIRTAAKSVGGGASRTRTVSHQEDLAEVSETSYRSEPAPEGSFLAETSFSRAPLNSRLPPISPHRNAGPLKAAGSARDKKGKGRPVESDDDEEQSGVLHELSDEVAHEEKALRERPEKENLEGLSPELQEALLLEDLLFVLMGIEGQYVEYDPAYSPEDEFDRLGGAHFVVDPLLLPWLADLVTALLPLARYYTALETFVEQYSLLELGVVNHALTAAIREMLRDYLNLIAQLEDQFLYSPTFSLRTMLFNLKPAIHRLSLIHALTTSLVALNLPSDSDSDINSGSDGADSSSDDSDDDELARQLKKDMKAAVSGVAKAAKTNEGRDWQSGGPAKGGEVLSVLLTHLERTAGDPVALAVYSTLLQKAYQPYATILLAWVTTGQLADPWEEFIVKETKGITRGSLEMDYTDEYWEKRYTLRDKGVKAPSLTKQAAGESARSRGLAGGAVLPTFLEPWKDKILLAGKYLNVIRECGIEVVSAQAGRDPDSVGTMIVMNDEAFYRRIDEAYSHANKLLLKTLMDDQQLAARLQSIKQYFFLDPADVFTHFLDISRLELTKKCHHASVSKLQSALELALRSLPMATDPYKDDVKLFLHSEGVVDWLVSINQIDGSIGGKKARSKGAKETAGRGEVKEDASKALLVQDALTLDYTVRFPLNVVISKSIILRYQLIFRYLLQLKLLERSLAEMWAEQTKARSWREASLYPELEQWKLRTFALRARMFSMVQQLYSFAVGEVLEPNWRLLEANLAKVETVDQLLKDHVNFLDTCMNTLLLTNAKVLLLHEKLVTTIKTFAHYMDAMSKALANMLVRSESRGAFDTDSSAKAWKLLTSFEKNFNHNFRAHLENVKHSATSENTALLPLFVRLTALKLPGEEQNTD